MQTSLNSCMACGQESKGLVCSQECAEQIYNLVIEHLGPVTEQSVDPDPDGYSYLDPLGDHKKWLNDLVKVGYQYLFNHPAHDRLAEIPGQIYFRRWTNQMFRHLAGPFRAEAMAEALVAWLTGSAFQFGLSLGHIGPGGSEANGEEGAGGPAWGQSAGDIIAQKRRDDDYELHIWEGGSLVRAVRRRPPRYENPPERQGGGTRGTVETYSPRSRWRFMQFMGRFPRKLLAESLFVTLTYPATYPDPRTAKQHLRAWFKRVRRKFKGRDVGFIWRMEPQARGAVHFHILVLGLRFMPYFWVAKSWAAVVDAAGEERQQHEQAGTEVRRVRSADHAIYYATKYLAKRDELGLFVDADGVIDENPGRFWGAESHRAFLAAVLVIAAKGHHAVELGRFMRKYIRARRRAWAKKKGEPPKRGSPYQDHTSGRSRSWLIDTDLITHRLENICGVIPSLYLS